MFSFQEERKRVVLRLFMALRDSRIFPGYTPMQIKEAAVRAEQRIYEESKSKEEYLECIEDRFRKIQKKTSSRIMKTSHDAVFQEQETNNGGIQRRIDSPTFPSQSPVEGTINTKGIKPLAQNNSSEKYTDKEIMIEKNYMPGTLSNYPKNSETTSSPHGVGGLCSKAQHFSEHYVEVNFNEFKEHNTRDVDKKSRSHATDVFHNNIIKEDGNLSEKKNANARFKSQVPNIEDASGSTRNYLYFDQNMGTPAMNYGSEQNTGKKNISSMFYKKNNEAQDFKKKITDSRTSCNSAHSQHQRYSPTAQESKHIFKEQGLFFHQKHEKNQPFQHSFFESSKSPFKEEITDKGYPKMRNPGIRNTENQYIHNNDNYLHPEREIFQKDSNSFMKPLKNCCNTNSEKLVASSEKERTFQNEKSEIQKEIDAFLSESKVTRIHLDEVGVLNLNTQINEAVETAKQLPEISNEFRAAFPISDMPEKCETMRNILEKQLEYIKYGVYFLKTCDIDNLINRIKSLTADMSCDLKSNTTASVNYGEYLRKAVKIFSERKKKSNKFTLNMSCEDRHK